MAVTTTPDDLAAALRAAQPLPVLPRGDVHTALVALAAEVRALRRAVEALRTQPPLRRGVDVDALARLLRAVGASWGINREFATSELTAFAAALDAGPRRELREALHGQSPRSLGLFLRRAADVVADGLVLERVGEDRAGAVWIVRECGS